MTTKLPPRLIHGIDTALGVEALRIPPPRQSGGSTRTLEENGHRFHQALTIFGLPDEKETHDQELNFDEAANELRGIFDLKDARRAAVHQQALWGLAEVLNTKGIIGKNREYADLFNEVKFTKKGIRIVRALLEQGHDMVAIFNPGYLSLQDAYDALIGKSGVAHWAESPALQGLSGTRKIFPDAKDLEGIEDYHTEVQIAELLKAFWIAGPLLVTRPLVTFTPLEAEVTLTGRTAIQLLQHKVQTIDPVSDWILWRMFLDARFAGESAQTPEAYRRARDEFLSTKKADEPLPGNISSVYPNYVVPDGGILAFTCDDKAKLITYCPDDASRYMGSRIAIS